MPGMVQRSEQDYESGLIEPDEAGPTPESGWQLVEERDF